MLFLYLSLLGLIYAVRAPDPLNDFCRLHSHQTAIVDRKLYIDGGFTNWAPLSDNPSNYSNSWLRVADFDADHEGFPQQSLLTKNSAVPSVSGGILWPDTVNKVIYAYGGSVSRDKAEPFKLWFYDILYDTWNTSGADSSKIERATWGAGATNPDKAVGYYYGGYVTNPSQPGWNDTDNVNTLISYDMVNDRFRFQSGPDSIARAEGVLLYIPAGDAGMLVYFGGIQTNYGIRTAQPMTEIFILDIGNSRWYKQTAGGAEVPATRRRFCAGAVWTKDRSSYNIYLFGGASAEGEDIDKTPQGIGYGDVWILSLPSFTWVKYFPNEDGDATEIPHHSASCNIYGDSQMIIMGGHFPNSTGCDVPANYGQHGLDLGRANDLGAKWVAFNASRTAYTVPPELTKVIGGNSQGNATATSPDHGWDSGDLAIMFKRSYTAAPRKPTRYVPNATPTPKLAPYNDPEKITIIGGVIGGACALLIVGVVAVCLFRHRRQRVAAEATYQAPPQGPPKPSSHPDRNLKSPAVQNWSLPRPPPIPEAELPGSLNDVYPSPYSWTSPMAYHPPTPRYSSLNPLYGHDIRSTISRDSHMTNSETMILYAPLIGAPQDAAARPWLRESRSGMRMVCELEGRENAPRVRGKSGIHLGDGREGGGGEGGWL